MERSDAADDAGTEYGCETSPVLTEVPLVGRLDTAEEHEENSCFKLSRKFWYIAT